MLTRARHALEQLGVDDVTRIDVPPKASGDEVSEGGLRASVQPAVPALQSGSLFGDRIGLLVVDAQWLLKAEAEVLAEVFPVVDMEAVAVVVVAAGAVPAPLKKVLETLGEKVTIKRLSERGAADWLNAAARERGVRLHGDAVQALIQRFGTDVGSLGSALDQLAASERPVDAELVRDWFRNRPDEPTWHYMDAVAAGDRAEALRRLEDFMIHGHPLVLLATIHTDLRRRSLSAAAPDFETFLDWEGVKKNYATEKIWKQRSRARAEDLRFALDAVSRADLALKTSPEPTHQVLMERLTVALCRWYGGAR